MDRKIKDMLDMQDALNISTSGEAWKEGTTSEGVQIQWNRCIYMEAMEAVDSFSWKHWKDLSGEPDWNNLRIEVTDIWHFIMSELIRTDSLNVIDDLDSSLIKDENIKPEEQETIISNLESLALKSLTAQTSGEEEHASILSDFYKILSSVGMSLDDLYKLYVVKNQLNQFRQAHGYKEGTYIKIWDSVEDNVIAKNIMDEDPQLTPTQFYRKLENEYEEVLKHQEEDNKDSDDKDSDGDNSDS